MTRTTLPIGIYPDLNPINGTCAYAYGSLIDNGVSIDQCDDGWPRFSVGGQLAYVDKSSIARVYGTSFGVGANNQVPIIWGDVTCPMVLAVKIGGPDPAPVMAYDLANLSLPAVQVGTCYAANSLARLQLLNGAYVLTTSADTPLNLPCWTSDGSGDVVSQAQQGGILATLGGTTGLLLPGEITGSPRIITTAPGVYSIIFWSWDSHGAIPMTRLDGVTKADLMTTPVIRPVSDVRPLPSVSVAGSYVFPR